MVLSNPAAIFILVLATTMLVLVLLILVGSQVLDPPIHRQQKSKGAEIRPVMEEASERK
ncbi:MAG: hypothetical protein HY314_06480 [Acidobacteria bacterium]|nr:hypothetical protein [Acidobacteriota bacterium]